MIYIHRDFEKVPDEVKTALKKAAEELDAIVDIDARKTYIEEHSKAWTAIRQYLEVMSHGKCWYSEAKEGVSRFQVDHFRPHGKAKQGLRDCCEGYSWLAFNIDNFRLAGMLCNTTNKEYSEESVGKGIWFPLADPARRASLQDRDISIETPCLLDPIDPEDPYKLWFNEDGNVIPDWSLPPKQREEIEKVIGYLGLRQSKLNGMRRSTLRRAIGAIMRYKDVDRVPKGDRTPRDIKNLNEARSELLSMSSPSGTFAAAVRCILVANGLKHLVRTDELKPLQLHDEYV